MKREREKESSECILDSAERLRVRGHLCREVEICMIVTSRQTYFLVKYFLVQTVKLHMCKVHVFLKCVAYELGSRQYDGTSYLDFSTFCILAFSLLKLNIFVYLKELK